MHERPVWYGIAAGLAVGIAVGFFVGRGQLSASWSRGAQPITKAQYARSASGDANPTPSVGAKVFAPMPIGRLRQDLGPMVAHDPLHVTVGAVGADDDGYNLHLVVQNDGACEVTSYAGVAYGFDPRGRPAAINLGGENYVAFRQELPKGKTLAPHAKETYGVPLRHSEGATLVVAHVDEATCADGTMWKR